MAKVDREQTIETRGKTLASQMLKISSAFEGLDQIVTCDEPIAPHTWYKLGGPARYMIRPEGVDELCEAAARCVAFAIPVYVLGAGANLLVSDEGVDGAVFQLSRPFWRSTRFEGDLVHVGGGVDLARLCLDSVRHGLAGLEMLAGIPATIGGAIRMNAGGRYGDIGSVVQSVDAVDLSGHQETITREQLVFGYRTSNITQTFIIGATLKLTPEPAMELAKRYKDIWMYKRNTQPLSGCSAGCMFRNPAGQSAGSLIDQAGLKGMRLGAAQVSEKHANFLIAHAGCTSADVSQLIKLVRERVFERFGVSLQTEVKRWPEHRANLLDLPGHSSIG